jgi:hypothetical protein
MKVEKFGNHGNNKGHVIILRIACGRKVNKRVNVKYINGRWIAENGLDLTSNILDLQIKREFEKADARNQKGDA